MILSDGEWRRLRRIEMELTKEDPALAEALRRWRASGPQMRRRDAAAVLGVGILCALLAVVLTNVPLAILAGVAVLGGWWSLRRTRDTPREVRGASRRPDLGPG